MKTKLLTLMLLLTTLTLSAEEAWKELARSYDAGPDDNGKYILHVYPDYSTRDSAMNILNKYNSDLDPATNYTEWSIKETNAGWTFIIYGIMSTQQANIIIKHHKYMNTNLYVKK